MIWSRGVERAEWAPTRQTFAVSRLVGVVLLAGRTPRTGQEKLFLNLARYQNAFEIHTAAVLTILTTSLFIAFSIRAATAWPWWTIALLLPVGIPLAGFAWNIVTVLNWSVPAMFSQRIRTGTNLTAQQFLCNTYLTLFSIYAVMRLPSLRAAAWIWLAPVAVNAASAVILLFFRAQERRIDDAVERTFRFDP